MAKTAVAVRLAPDVIEWADGYAASRGKSRQAVLEAAVLAFREECSRGVPDLEVADAVRGGGGVLATTRPVTVDSAADARRWALERQAKLNRPKGL